MDVLNYDKLTLKNIRSRKIKAGPEYDLVESFLERYQDLFCDNGYSLSVLIEPFMEIGYPDIVAVSWNKDVFKNLNTSRFEINKLDIKILNQLSLGRGQNQEDIRKNLGFDACTIMSSLKRLEQADLVINDTNLFKARPLGDIFAPTKIIAIEAKIADWKRAFHQAQLNHLFASESYVLFPGKVARKELLEYSENYRVGLLMGNQGRFSKLSAFSENEIPSSYGNWYLNELLYRVAHL